ncbi:MAG: hypothetical protein IPG89_18430 [Bacteroidetes bacterium]|nr:hypothetical protein [Bacteroidota bacterium]
MTLPLHIAKKLQALKETNSISASLFNKAFTDSFIADGILIRQSLGRTKYKLVLKDSKLLDVYLKNKYGVSDLSNYIEVLEKENIEGHEAVVISSDSKIKKIRTFKGFLINSYDKIECSLNGEPFICYPQAGSFAFIYDFEHFNIPSDIIVIGIENSENFRLINRQKHLFNGMKPLFVSRYPQGGDLVKWLLRINNPYIHFGDFDFAGISIYLTEYKKHLKDRASFLVPTDIQDLIKQYGSRKLYNQQQHLKESILINGDLQVINLINAIDSEKKGLEQQVLIK